jgi:hypothetical protein
MRGVRVHLLAGVGSVCLLGACSFLTTFDGFSGEVAEGRDAEAGAPDTAVPSMDAADGDVHAEGSDGADGVDGADASCATDLSNIGTADFTISATVTTTQTNTVAVANQRAVCNGSDFWDVHLQDGDVQAETDDGLMHHTVVNTPGPAVNDGKPHSISVQRRNEALTVYVDGVVAGTAMSASAFGLLPQIQWGTSPCVGHTNYFSFVGPITNKCVSSP